MQTINVGLLTRSTQPRYQAMSLAAEQENSLLALSLARETAKPLRALI